MERIVRRESIVIIFALVLFLILLYPVMMHARREARDGIRRDEIAAFKRVMEDYFNEHETYPLEFDAKPHRYVVTEKSATGATAWYLQAELENQHDAGSGYDGDEGRQYHWRYIQEGNRTYYEVCGGTPTCEADDRR